MLKRVCVANFEIDINKYVFCVIEINYLKLIISINEIKMHFSKIQTVVKENTSLNIKHVKSFIDFCKFQDDR